MNNIMSEYNQYIINKSDYNNLIIKDKMIDGMIGGKKRFSCNKTNEFTDICYEKEDGKYKSKDGCVNECILSYIDYNLEKIRIKKETNAFKYFIYELFEKDMKVYIKGGSVLGLYVLKMIFDQYKNNIEMFQKTFDEFLKLDLIKDWDFSGLYQKPIDEDETKNFNKMAKKYQLYPHAKKFILYQTKFPIKIGDDALFEISILEDKEDAICNLELPMTTMSMQIHKRNINYVFMFAKLFYSHKKFNHPIDINVVMYMISNMNMFVYPYTDRFVMGLFRINKINRCELSDDLINFIEKFNKNKNVQQFLITHIQEPNRLFYRLTDKNIPKSKKIFEFLESNSINKNTDWILDKNINKIVDNFCGELGDKLISIYKNSNIETVDKFLEGVNLKRFQDYDKFYNLGKKNISIVFSPLFDAISSEIESLSSDIKIVKALKFLHSKEYI